ncbi:MAG: hypothetical protein GWO11_05250 [Desulfuromonadales bacterium]|nr:hypothetical protein [Desulfuromonadales bacterium]NIR33801.1 hypothetical protein [Desulfuromonadales bacterium]NIS42504.1 hypothetical protein [Desulfuromonadales bacterium]
MGMAHKGVRYMGSALSLLLGAGAALSSSYLASRIKEKQDVESRLDRLEQMLAELEAAQKTPKAPARKTAAKKAPAKKANK